MNRFINWLRAWCRRRPVLPDSELVEAGGLFLGRGVGGDDWHEKSFLRERDT